MGRDGLGWAGIRLGWICYLSGFFLWQRCPSVTQVFSTLRTYRTFIFRKKIALVALMSLDLHLGCGKSLISIKELGQQSHYSTRTLSTLCWGVSQPSCRARLVSQCKKCPLSSFGFLLLLLLHPHFYSAAGVGETRNRRRPSSPTASASDSERQTAMPWRYELRQIQAV